MVKYIFFNLILNLEPTITHVFQLSYNMLQVNVQMNSLSIGHVYELKSQQRGFVIRIYKVKSIKDESNDWAFCLNMKEMHLVCIIASLSHMVGMWLNALLGHYDKVNQIAWEVKVWVGVILALQG